jgi:UDP-N-acetylglucosamine--N-acetylmuramyl-(pentapeptide) pyrophosphoryl-undecaprenol N-acetylglucosamine transferase
LESRLVRARGERLETIPGLPWARQGLSGRFRALSCLASGVTAARRILRREKIQLVIGAGGYASFSTCVAAYTLGLPVVIHEANAAPGLANRYLGRLATLTCVGFAEAGKHMRGAVELTGIPTGAIVRSQPRDAPPWHFLVLGGSEGSPMLNRAAPGMFVDLRRRGIEFSVRHICGFGDAAAIAAAYRDGGVEAHVDVFVDDMASVYQGATLAIASAGAITAAELSAAGVPAFLVPLSGAANDHQSANAAAYAARTGAIVVKEFEWDAGRLAVRIADILANPEELRLLRERAGLWNNADAALHVVRACERILGFRKPSFSRDPVAVK